MDPETLTIETPASNIIRPVTPILINLQAQEEDAEMRPPSPFPAIPDVSLDKDVLEEDIKSFKAPKSPEPKDEKPPESISPFPGIPDINLNPEIIEKDVEMIRRSPSPFYANINRDDVEVADPPRFSGDFEEDQVNQPYPTIPNIADAVPKDEPHRSFYKPIKKFAPVSLTGKKYPLILNPGIPPQNVAGEETKPEKPQYMLAETDSKVVEKSVAADASCVRSLQTEIFESQGHFSTGGCRSPYPVFIPSEAKPPPENVAVKQEERAVPKQQEEYVEPKDLSRMQLADKETRRLIDNQQKCFSEVKEIKQCYQEAELLEEKYPLDVQAEPDNEVTMILTKMKKARAGYVEQTLISEDLKSEVKEFKQEDDVVVQNEVKRPKEDPAPQEAVLTDSTPPQESNIAEEQTNPPQEPIRNSPPKQEPMQQVLKQPEPEVRKQPSIQQVPKQTEPEEPKQPSIQQVLKQTESEEPKRPSTQQVQKQPEPEEPKQPKRKIPPPIEKPKHRKPPETIIGARPLFGAMNINEEFKKAVDRRQSFHHRKNKDSAVTKIEQSTREAIVKDDGDLEKDGYSNKSMMFSQSNANEMAKVETIRLSENEEIEKIYYETQREYDIDYQTVQEEVIVPSFTTNVKCYTKLNNGETICEVPPKISIEIHPPQNFAYDFSENVSEKITKEKYQHQSEYSSTSAQHYRQDLQSFNLQKSQVSSAEDYTKNIINEQKHHLKNVDIPEQHLSDVEYDEEYQKIPVKSLIRNFEQSTMPPLKVKQIREPLPDVVEKLQHSSSQSEVRKYYNSTSSTKERQFLQQAERDFDNLYNVDNAQQSNGQSFNHDENSSFRKYDARKSFGSYEEIRTSSGGVRTYAKAEVQAFEGKGYAINACFIYFAN